MLEHDVPRMERSVSDELLKDTAALRDGKSINVLSSEKRIKPGLERRELAPLIGNSEVLVSRM